MAAVNGLENLLRGGVVRLAEQAIEDCVTLRGQPQRGAPELARGIEFVPWNHGRDLVAPIRLFLKLELLKR